MAEFIGNWAVKLSANASGLVSGLQDAAAQTNKFTSFAATSARTMATGVNSALAGISRIDMGAQLGQLSGLASRGIDVVAGFATGGIAAGVSALVAAGAAMISYASSSMDAVAVQVRLGRQIGVTAQEAAGLQVIATRAGVAPESLSSGLDKWARQLAKLQEEVSSGNAGPMTQALARMGISAREFASVSLPQQFSAVSAGVASMTNPMERQATLFTLLGRAAADLAPVFRQNSTDLLNMGAVGERAGVRISQSDAEMVGATVKGLKQTKEAISAFFNNVGQSIAVMFAPFAKATGEVLESLTAYARPLVYVFIAMASVGFAPLLLLIGGVLAAVRFLMPAFEGVGRLLSAIGAAGSEAFSHLGPVFREIGAAIVAAFGDARNPLEGFGAMMKEVAENVGVYVRFMAVMVAVAVRDIASGLRNAALLISTFAQVTANLTGSAQSQSQADGAMAFAVQMAQASQTATQAMNNIAASGGAVAAQAQSGGLALQQMAASATPLSQQWERQIETIGRTQREQEILKAIANGATEAQIQKLEELNQVMTRAENENKAREGTQAVWDRYYALRFTTRELEDQRLASQGVSAALRQQRQSAWDMLEAQERLNRLRKEGERVAEQVQNPVERFAARTDELWELLNEGMISDDTFQRAITQQFTDLERNGERERSGPAVAIKGSVDEQRAIANAQRQDQRANRDPVERLRQIAERQQRIQQQQEQHMRTLVDLARAGGLREAV